MKRTFNLGSALMAVCVLVAPLGAQDAVLRAKERAQLLTDFRALLEHSDAATRRAAFEEAMASKDVALQSMAMDEAMGGTDNNLKTAALRVYLNGRATLPITVLLPDRSSDGVAQFFAKWNGLQLSKLAVKDDGTITAGADWFGFQGGQLISGGIDLRLTPNNASRCTLTAKVVSAKQLVGSLDCSILDPNYVKAYGASRITFPVRIDLP
jgi:hypothetical protein